MKDIWDKLENLVGDFSKYYPNGHGINPFTFLLAPILGLLFFVFLILGNWKSITHWIDRSLTTNEIIVSSNGDIDLTHVNVTWKMDYTNEMVVYGGGQLLYTDFFERGENHFSVSYYDSIIASFTHVKASNLDGHTYIFRLEESMRCIDVMVEIEGPSDSLKWLQKPDCLALLNP